jgi:hypothetical protein
MLHRREENKSQRQDKTKTKTKTMRREEEKRMGQGRREVWPLCWLCTKSGFVYGSSSMEQLGLLKT